MTSRFLRFTPEAIRELGDGVARVLRVGPEHQGWYAGAQPLNGQAVQDLVADGWLRQSADSHEVRIDAWPGFARRTEVTAMPSEAANLIRDLRRQADLPLFGIGKHCMPWIACFGRADPEPSRPAEPQRSASSA